MRFMRVNHKAVFLLAAGIMILCQAQAQIPANDMPDQQNGSAAGMSRHPDAISYRGHTPRLRKIEDPSGEYCSIVLPGHHYTSETGKPELPVYSRIVEVPQGMKVKVALSGILTSKIRFADQGLGNAQIYPSQPARTKNEAQDQKVVVKDRKIYESKGTLSHDTVVISTVGTFRGHEMVNIAIYPAFYDPAGGYVDLITSMNVSISYVPSDTKGVSEVTDI